MEVQRGRYTADIDGDFVVFLIGMRLNHPLRIRKWWPVAAAMPRMLKLLSQHPELGCLGFQQWFGRTTILVQYWRDFDSLDRFAKDRDLPHLEPWRRFNRAVRASGDVGIWHETFRVRAGEYEAVYGNMPVFGLAAAATHLPAARKGNTAATPHRRQHHRRAGRRAVLTATSLIASFAPYHTALCSKPTSASSPRAHSRRYGRLWDPSSRRPETVQIRTFYTSARRSIIMSLGGSVSSGLGGGRGQACRGRVMQSQPW